MKEIAFENLIFNITLKNDKGTTFKNLTSNQLITKIDMRDVPTGIYYAHVEADGIVKTIRVMKR